MKCDNYYKKLRNGIISIAGSSFINKIIALISNIIVIRFVSQYEYGLFSNAYNIISFTMLITGAGTINGVLQYGSEKGTFIKKLQYFKFSLFLGTIFDLVLIIILFTYVQFGLIPFIEAKKYIFMLLPSIVFHFWFEYVGAIIRSKKETTYYAVILSINSLSYSILSCLGAYFFGIQGMIFGRNISYIIAILVGSFFNRKDILPMFLAEKLDNREKSSFLIYSFSCCITAALNRLLYIIDVMIISYMVKSPEEIAIYKVGTQIPEALEFIPQSILIAVIPYFVENRENKVWLRKWTKKLYLYSGIFNFVITVLLILASPIIVVILWGEQYKKSIPIFIILSLNYFVMGTFRQPGTNILSALRKIKYNVVISCITCVVNIYLDIIFINKWGINGAAIATLLTVIFTSSLSFPYIYNLIYNSYRKK